MTLSMTRRRFVGSSLAAWLAACLPDVPYKHRYTTVPERLDDGLDVDTPASVGLDPRDLADIHDELLREDRHRGALGMLVIKDGKLVWETYLRSPDDRDLHHHIQSVTKSVTSLAFGLARDGGYFPSLDATLSDLIPEALTGRASDKGKIRLADLLTMRSGIELDNRYFSLEMWVDKPKDPLHHILSKPFYDPPGERFYYRDADPQVLGYLLQKAVGRSEQRFVDKALFDPLGIRDYLWEHGPDGASMAPHGLHLKPRDLAKLGLLMADGGMHRERALISKSWCDESTRAHVPPGQDTTKHDDFGYGYYWWTVQGTDMFSAWGHGGQYVLVSPERRLVMVRVAMPDTGEDLHGTRLEHFVELVQPLL